MCSKENNCGEEKQTDVLYHHKNYYNYFYGRHNFWHWNWLFCVLEGRGRQMSGEEVIKKYCDLCLHKNKCWKPCITVLRAMFFKKTLHNKEVNNGKNNP